MVAMCAFAGPVVIAEPELQELDQSKVKRVPSFSGTGGRVALPPWLGEAWDINFSPDGLHIASDDYEKLSFGTTGGASWTVNVGDGSDARFIDESLLVTSLGYDDGFAIRDVSNGKIKARFEGYMPDVLAVSPDGKHIAMDGDGGVRIRSMDGTETQVWATDNYMNDLQFSADGKRLLMCSDEVRLWDLERDRITFFESGREWYGCTADPDLEVAWVGRGDGVIERIPLEWDKPRTAWRFGSPVRDLAWIAPDVLMVASDAPFTAVVDFGKGRVVAHLEGKADEVHATDGRLVRIEQQVATWSWPDLKPGTRPWQAGPTALATDGEVVATGDDSGAILIYRGDKLVHHLWGFADEITDLDFSGDLLAVGDWAGKVWIVAWRTGEIVRQIDIIEGETFVQWSPDGEVLIASSANEDDPSWMEIWDAKTWERLHKSKRQELASFAFASHGEWFAASGDSSNVQVIHTRTGTVLRSVGVNYSQDWTHVGVVDDKQVVAFSVGDDANYLWHPPEKPETVEAWGWAVAFTDDGRKVAVDSDDEALVVFDSATGREIWRKRTTDIYVLEWAPDGRTLYSAHANGDVKSWTVNHRGSPAIRDDMSDLSVADLSKVPQWTKVRELNLHSNFADSLSVADDGRIAVAAVDNQVLLLGPDGEETGRLGSVYVDYSDRMDHVWFAPDGALVTTDNNDMTQVWRDGEAVDSKEKCRKGTLEDGQIKCSDRYRSGPRKWRGAFEVDGQVLPSQPGQPTLGSRSPNGSRIVVAARQLAVVWDVQSRKPIGVLEGDTGTAVAWSQDGKQVITLGSGTLTWWAPK